MFYILIVVGSLIGLWIVLYFVPIGLWLSARISGVQVSLWSLMFMRFRKIPPEIIVASLIEATKAGVYIHRRDLETLHLSGGNIKNVVQGLITAKKANINLTFQMACALDRKGMDLLKEIEKRMKN